MYYYKIPWISLRKLDEMRRRLNKFYTHSSQSAAH